MNEKYSNIVFIISIIIVFLVGSYRMEPEDTWFDFMNLIGLFFQSLILYGIIMFGIIPFFSKN
tara:strand:- start:98 stop:286 length:189 start_codon:yes stop_codon:yes gene_type:complete